MATSYEYTTTQVHPLAVFIGVTISLFVFMPIVGVFFWRHHKERKRVIKQFSDKPFDWMHVYKDEIVVVCDYPYERVSTDELYHDTPLYRAIKRHEQTIRRIWASDLSIYDQWKQLMPIKRQMNREIMY